MKRSTLVTTGLVLNALVAASNLPTLVVPTAGPAPVFINVLCGVVAIAVLAGVVMVWRHRRGGVATIVVGQVILALTSLPAFFASVSTDIRILSAASLVVTLVAVLLVLPARRSRVAVAS